MVLTFLDGRNSPQNISFYGFGLGAVGGGGAIFAVLSLLHYSWPSLQFEQHLPFALYLMILAVFHCTEYIVTAIYNGPKLSLDSYLINHSTEYSTAFLIATVEYFLESYFFGPHKWNGAVTALGLIITIIGQYFRTGAMVTAKANFSHQIADRKEEDHRLVTTGLYSLVRHPSYCGFFLWAVGSQILLCNPVATAGFAFAVYRFFKERFEYEEYTLVKFFGDEYVQYRKKVPSGVPFIP